MAQLNQTESKRSGNGRSKKSPAIDLTAMVDLAFLLITFFMLTTSLAKQRAMDINLPVDTSPMSISEDRTLSICLGKNNQIQWYMGMLEKPVKAPKTDMYGSHGIRRSILTLAKEVKNTKSKDLIVLIKPSDRSSYKNLVDILDEMKITGISRYVIADITPDELQMMTETGLY